MILLNMSIVKKIYCVLINSFCGKIFCYAVTGVVRKTIYKLNINQYFINCSAAVPLTLLSCLQPLHCLDDAIFIPSET